jgi:urease accessory protein
MSWYATLKLHYQSAPLADAAPRTTLQFVHDGPLRVLQSLYPEGPVICHNVLVHPPGGIVGGDTLDIQVRVDSGAHALITTPAATRFYKSMGEAGIQQVDVKLHSGARLEWLPLETIAYNGCNAFNKAVFNLEPGAEMIGWDMTALGLPHADLPYVRGSIEQHIEVKDAWLERARIDATDTRLLQSPLGLAGHLCMGTLFFAAGDAIERNRRDSLLEKVRAILSAHPLASTAGATSPHPRVIAVRLLAPMTEPAMELLQQVWLALRQAAWNMPGTAPRIWSM